MADTPTTIDEYIEGFPADVQVILRKNQEPGCGRGCPTRPKTISYGIPTFTIGGRYLVYFAGWKNHVSVYPIPTGDEAFQREVERAVRGRQGHAEVPPG